MAQEQRASKPVQAPRSTDDPIAVIGIGLRFPGDLDSTEAFWEFLKGKGDAVTEIPAQRWQRDAYYDPKPGTAGKMSTRWGGFLEDVRGFDAEFFGVSTPEAKEMDPQQRLALEVAWHALEDAGLATQSLKGSNTGVFLGVCNSDYGQLRQPLQDPTRIGPYYGTGTANSFVAGRLSYVLGLNGPSMSIDTACSSSLVAVHVACQHLRTGDCDLALAGGVNLLLSPIGGVYVSQVRAVSADGHCKAFDASADGYVRSEGCAVIALKRLDAALADGDKVLGVLAASAVNHDGRAAGLTVPSRSAQEDLLTRALGRAGVTPEAVEFIETHGTGTPLGDPIEFAAIDTVFASQPRRRALALGSVKANLGHLESAAGIAGLIKVILALSNQEIPPQVHFDTPNPHLAWNPAQLDVPTECRPWPLGDSPRYAGVSSFGFSGTNAHVVVQEAPAQTLASPAPAPSNLSEHGALLPLSARSPDALREYAQRLRQLVATPANSSSLEQLCHSAGTRRAHHEHRAALIVNDTPQLLDALQQIADNTQPPTLNANKRKLVFVFPGQGGQWALMGQRLLQQEPVFRRAVEQCEQHLLPLTGWSVIEVLRADPGAEPVDGDNIEVTQVALFTLQVALAALWQHWGITPNAVVGHSMGEVAAAYTAGLLPLHSAARVIATRAKLLRQAEHVGAMAAVELPTDQAEALLHQYPDICIAAANSPRSTVLSGSLQPMRRIVERLEHDGVFVRWLQTTGVASHCPQVQATADALAEHLAGIDTAKPTLRMISTVTAQPLEQAGPDYWQQNLRQCVNFQRAVELLLDSEHVQFLEIGAHPTLAPALNDCAKRAGQQQVLTVASLARQHGERAVLLEQLARLYTAGHDIQWDAVNPAASPIRLPAYPFQRKPYWFDLDTSTGAGDRPAARPASAREGRLILGAELATDPALAKIEALLATWGSNGARAINRPTLMPDVFLAADHGSFLYCRKRDDAITAMIFVGRAPDYAPLIESLERWSGERGQRLTVLADAAQADTLRGLGFSATVCGELTTLRDTRELQLAGGHMRRLRYQLSRYESQPRAQLQEIKADASPLVRQRLINLIDAWNSMKGNTPPAFAKMRQALATGWLNDGLRVFAAARGTRIDCFIVVSPVAQPQGYLLDLEFYSRDVPGGALEYAIIHTMALLRQEGTYFFSLGGSYGAGLERTPGDDAALAGLLHELQRQGVLDGESNRRFKRKFRGDDSKLFLCHQGQPAEHCLQDFLAMLSGIGDSPTASKAEPFAVNSLRWRVESEGSKDIIAGPVGRTSVEAFSDHRVQGEVVLPGAALLAMVAAAPRTPQEQRDVEIRDTVLHRSIELEGEQSAWLVCHARDDANYDYEISLEGADAGENKADHLCASGSVHLVPPTPTAQRASSVVELEAQCQWHLIGEQYYERLEALGYGYTGAFRCVQNVAYAEDLVVARIGLTQDRSAAQWSKHVEQVILLDACLQVLPAPLLKDLAPGAAPWVLHGVERLRWRRDLPDTAWAVGEITERSKDGHWARAALRILDADGEVLCELEGIHAVRLARPLDSRQARRNAPHWCHKLEWQALDQRKLQPSSQDRDAARGWLLICEDGQLASVALEAFEHIGDRCWWLEQGARFEQVSAQHFTLESPITAHLGRVFSTWRAREDAPLAGIIYLQASTAVDAADLTAIELNGCIREHCSQATALLKAVAADSSMAPAVWIATCGAQTVDDESPAPDLAPLWGLGRVAANEHPEIWGGLIDLDPAASLPEKAQALIRALAPSCKGLGEIAVRGNHAYRPLLIDHPRADSPELQLREDGTYLITGGLGGIGLSVAEWLVELGAKHLVLVSRQGLRDDVLLQDRIDQLRSRGSRVDVQVADAGRTQSMAELIGRYASSLRGVFHSAGIVDDRLLIRQSWAHMERVIWPKVCGAWNLHRLTQDLPLEHFVLFSSAASVMAPIGQASHAAANCAMDAIAQYRRRQGLPALTINWGPWSEVGFAARQRVTETLQAAGHKPISVRQGLACLGYLMTDPQATQALVMQPERDIWAPWHDEGPKTADSAPAPTVTTAPSSEAQLACSTVPASVNAYLRQQLAEVANRHVSEEQEGLSLDELGVDSLMKFELRSRIEGDLGVTLPLLLLFRDASIESLVQEIQQRTTDHPANSSADAAAQLRAAVTHES